MKELVMQLEKIKLDVQKKQVKQYTDQLSKYEANKSTFYKIIWRQYSEVMQAKLQGKMIFTGIEKRLFKLSIVT